MCIESVMPSNHLILCRPLFLLPSTLPASGSFPMSQLFMWGGQSTGVFSFSISPSNEHPGLSCNLLNTVLKMKKRKSGYRCKCINCLPFWLCGWPEAAAHHHWPASRESNVAHIVTLGKDQNSKFEVKFLLNLYFFHVFVKSNNHESNHREMGTVCIMWCNHRSDTAASLPYSVS